MTAKLVGKLELTCIQLRLMQRSHNYYSCSLSGGICSADSVPENTCSCGVSEYNVKLGSRITEIQNVISELRETL